MALIKFHKIAGSLLPQVLEPNAFYYLEREVDLGDGSPFLVAEGYLTNKTGQARALGNVSLIGNIASALISQQMSAMQAIRMAPDIAARDTIAAEDPQINKLILVADASADPTVETGSALYFYDVSEETFTKVAEYESMDITFSWANLDGKPNSTPTQIDDAVGKAHTHANKAVLDELAEDGNQKLTYRGQSLGGDLEWATVDW